MKKGDCKWFNGIQNECCDKGINYKELTAIEGEPAMLQLPCIKASTKKKVDKANCFHFQEPNDAEIELYERNIKKAAARVMEILPKMLEIKETYKGKDWQGKIGCPICSKEISVAHFADSGRIWMHCETKGCISTTAR